jgi:hypothetical protein
MLVEIKHEAAVQKCNCGEINTVAFKDIKYVNSGLPQFILPVCPECKTRIEFIFIGTNMTQPEFQLMVKMRQIGLME